MYIRMIIWCLLSEGFNKEDFKNVKLEPDNQTGIINNCDKKDVLKSLSYYPKNTKSLITVPHC